MSVANPVIDRLDLSTKHIYLLAGTVEYHPVSDIYVEIRNIRSTDETMRVFDMPVTAFGAVPKGGGKYTSRYAQFNHGWRIVPDDVDHSLYVSGEQITDDGQSGPACIDTTVLSAGTSVIIHYEPPASELVKAEDELAAIKRMAFDRVVTLNDDRGISGTEWPIGTHSTPSDNIADSMLIKEAEGLSTIHFETDLSLIGLNDYSGVVFVGASKAKTTLDLASEPDVTNTEIYDCEVTGVLDGDVTVSNCLIANLNYVTGYIEQCVLAPGVIQLGGGLEAHFLDCWSGVPGEGTPTIDCGATGTALAMRNYAGGVRLTNKSGPEAISIDLASGQIRLTSTVTGGTLVVRGIGKLIDDVTGEHIHSGIYGDLVIINELINTEEISDAVWDEDLTGHNVPDSTGEKLAELPNKEQIATAVWGYDRDISTDSDEVTADSTTILADTDGS